MSSSTSRKTAPKRKKPDASPVQSSVTNHKKARAAAPSRKRKSVDRSDSAADNEPREKKSRPSDSAALRQKKEDLLRGVLNSASDDVKRRFIEAYGLHRHEQQLRGEIASTPEKNTRGKDALTLEALVNRLREREVLPSFNDEVTALAQARQLIDTKEVDVGAINALSVSVQELRIQRKAKTREESKDATAKEEAKEEKGKGKKKQEKKGGSSAKRTQDRDQEDTTAPRKVTALSSRYVPKFASLSSHLVHSIKSRTTPYQPSIPSKHPTDSKLMLETTSGPDSLRGLVFVIGGSFDELHPASVIFYVTSRHGRICLSPATSTLKVDYIVSDHRRNPSIEAWFDKLTSPTKPIWITFKELTALAQRGASAKPAPG